MESKVGVFRVSLGMWRIPPNPSVSSQGLVGDQRKDVILSWEEHAGMYLYLEVVLIFFQPGTKHAWLTNWLTSLAAFF